MAADLLVRNVRPLGGDLADILISAGRIERGPTPDGVTVLDGGGRIALPGLVEAHTHLDKSLLDLSWYRNEVGPRLIDKIENERKVRKTLPIDPRRQSQHQACLSVTHGSTFIRSHVDVDTECGVAGVEGVMAPMVSTVEECEALIAACLYPPRGRRGSGPRRASNYYRDAAEYMALANDTIFIMPQVENIATIDVIDEFLAVPGIDAVAIGPNDMSGTAGVFGVACGFGAAFVVSVLACGVVAPLLASVIAGAWA